MQVRTFFAPDIKTAMQLAREAMGDEAVMLSTDTKPEGVSATFALDRGADEWIAPAKETSPQTLPAAAAAAIQSPNATDIRKSSAAAPSSPPPTTAPASSIEAVLHHHATPASVIDYLASISNSPIDRSAQTYHALTEQIAQLLASAFEFSPLPLESEGFRLMVVGPPGAGKTITAAKIAARMVVDNRPIRIITTDGKRAGGPDQLQAFANVMGLHVDVAESSEELSEMLAQLSPSMRVIIDTASCNPYDFSELKELGAFASLPGIEPILVCPAGIESGEAEEIAGVFSFLNIGRALISRTDCARRFGSALAVVRAGGYRFCHFTSSARAMGDFAPASPQALARLLTQYQRDRMAA